MASPRYKKGPHDLNEGNTRHTDFLQTSFIPEDNVTSIPRPDRSFCSSRLTARSSPWLELTAHKSTGRQHLTIRPCSVKSLHTRIRDVSISQSDVSCARSIEEMTTSLLQHTKKHLPLSHSHASRKMETNKHRLTSTSQAFPPNFLPPSPNC